MMVIMLVRIDKIWELLDKLLDKVIISARMEKMLWRILMPKNTKAKEKIVTIQLGKIRTRSSLEKRNQSITPLQLAMPLSKILNTNTTENIRRKKSFFSKEKINILNT